MQIIRVSYFTRAVIHLLLNILQFFFHLCVHKYQTQVGMKEEKCRFCFFRQGQKALRTGLCTAHLQKQSHLLVQPVPSPFSLYSLYCPLACFPQCYKLRTTQTSRPKALLWMPSKLHFLESQRLASLITPGTLSGSPIYWQAEKHKTGPSQARKTPALLVGFFYTTIAECLILFSNENLCLIDIYTKILSSLRLRGIYLMS